jgi:hypothetical protein
MKADHLELRSLWRVVAALVVAPPIVALASCLLVNAATLPFRTGAERPTLRMLLSPAWSTFLGSIIGYGAELIFAVPLLIGLKLFRWRWLNAWTMALLGFAIATGRWSGAFLKYGAGAALFGWPVTTVMAIAGGLAGIAIALLIRFLALKRPLLSPMEATSPRSA